MKFLKLTVKKSRLPGAGMGLFSRVAFRKGDRIAEYAGRRRKWTEARKEDGYNGYLLRLSRNLVIDARPNRKSPGRYANDAAGFGRAARLRNNTQYLIYGTRCFIVATRDIRKGEEILVSYGREFWALQRRIKSVSTPNSR